MTTFCFDVEVRCCVFCKWCDWLWVFRCLVWETHNCILF